MTSRTRTKGNRSVRKAISYYEMSGWLVDKVEKTGRFVIDKDLYSLFDLIGIRRNKVVFIQVKTNRPPKRKNYVLFAKKFGGSRLHTESFTWYDRKGFVIHKFMRNGLVERLDLRK